jgi:hypothetical protein
MCARLRGGADVNSGISGCVFTVFSNKPGAPDEDLQRLLRKMLIHSPGFLVTG